MSSVGDRFTLLSAELAASAAAAGRHPEDVRLVCVSKTATIEDVRGAYAAGARVFGENRIESLIRKRAALPEVEWHFIGNIQARKIRDIVANADLIHSVWRADQLPRLDRAAQACGKVQDILIEVNAAGEASKDGLAPEEVAAFAEACEGFAHLRVRGLMTMAPQGDPEADAQSFRKLAALREDLIALRPERAATCTELSMGMSEDWRLAVAAGSTMVRLGRAIFSESFGEMPGQQAFPVQATDIGREAGGLPWT